MLKRRTSWRTVALALIPLTLLGSACLPVPPPWEGQGPHVLVFGDSLTYGLEHGPGLDNDNRYSFLTDQLVAHGFSASVSALIGARTDDLPGVTPKVPAPGADIMLIALGTNDMAIKSNGQTGLPLDVALGHIAVAIAEVGATCNILVTIAETKPWGLNISAPAYNEALREMPDVVVADWAPLVKANPLLVGSDGVHLTAAGSVAYRNLYLDSIDTCRAAL